jgi:hypothetical protein
MELKSCPGGSETGQEGAPLPATDRERIKLEYRVRGALGRQYDGALRYGALPNWGPARIRPQ